MLKGHSRGITRGTTESRLTASHYAICIYCWTSKAKQWWGKGLVGKSPGTLYGKNAMYHHHHYYRRCPWL